MNQKKELENLNLTWEEVLGELDDSMKVRVVLLLPETGLIYEHIVAALFKIDIETINMIVDDNMFEFVDDLHVMFDNEVDYLSEEMLKNPIDVSKRTVKYTKRAILRLCMFLEDSELAKAVRTQLIDFE